MFTNAVMKEIEIAARRLGVETAALAAVAHIESGARSHAMIDGRAEPLIRFEGHYFDRRLAGAKRDRARQEGLASPQAGRITNPSTQAARWKLLARAAAIDRAAAYESVSWGVGQVMGAHWAWLGHASVDALAAEARAGVAGQLRLMTGYIAKAGLAGALRSHDWAGFARGYNGPNYRANAYDAKLARAYARYASTPAGSSNPGIGQRGEAVRELQSALVAHGFTLEVDGVFGPLTGAAIRAFQKERGLVVDGIAGPATMTALKQEKRARGVIIRVFEALKRLFRSHEASWTG